MMDSAGRYWALEAREHTDDLDTTVGTVRELLEDIVARQLISDVPLGTLLSGGLDSSTITALAQRHGQIRSFAVDFAGYADNFEPDEMRVDADVDAEHPPPQVVGRFLNREEHGSGPHRGQRSILVDCRDGRTKQQEHFEPP